MVERAEKAIELYWDQLIDRYGQYELSRGKWLDELYWINDLSGKLRKAEQSDKARVALWGASQTGKSTFLSTYIDAGASIRGEGGALDWGEPVRFGEPVSDEKVPEDVTVFNPFNRGRDASGAITWFTMVSEDSPSIDRSFPVEVRMATSKQVMHALAAGFCSECEHQVPGIGKRYWGGADLEALLDEFRIKAQPDEEADVAEERRAYELLREVVDVLDLLCLSRLPRYENLADDYQTYRRHILNCKELADSYENVVEFASILFWDGISALTSVYAKIISLLEHLEKTAGMAAPVLRCSFRIAALLVDIESYQKLKDERDPRIKEAVNALRLVSTSSGLALTTENNVSAAPLVGHEYEKFALLQSVIWCLVLPLKEENLRQGSEVCHRFFSKADLIDFPGAAKEDPREKEQKLTAAILEDPAESHRLYTELIKRGKTSSIVVASSVDYDIDVYGVMARMMAWPSKPEQLVAGIDVWWRSFTGEAINDASSKRLPLNLIFTFCGGLVSDIISRTSEDLEGVWSMYDGLGPLGDPKIADFLATTYDQFEEGRIINSKRRDSPAATQEERSQALGALKLNDSFASRFSRIETLEGMVLGPDGGTDYVLNKFSEDVGRSRRAELIGDMQAEIEGRWESLFSYPVVPGDGSGRRRILLNRWRDRIYERLEDLQASSRSADAAQILGSHLRRFFYVNPEELDELPEMLETQPNYDIADYLEEQLAIWMDSSSNGALEDLALESDEEEREIRGYLVDSVLDQEDSLFKGGSKENSIEYWLRRNFGALGDLRARQDARSFLALRLADALTGDLHRKQPRAGSQDEGESIRTEWIEATRNMNSEEYRKSPHYQAFLAPLISYFEELCEEEQGERPEQAGDDELIEILS